MHFHYWPFVDAFLEWFENGAYKRRRSCWTDQKSILQAVETSIRIELGIVGEEEWCHYWSVGCQRSHGIACFLFLLFRAAVLSTWRERSSRRIPTRWLFLYWIKSISYLTISLNKYDHLFEWSIWDSGWEDWEESSLLLPSRPLQPTEYTNYVLIIV